MSIRMTKALWGALSTTLCLENQRERVSPYEQDQDAHACKSLSKGLPEVRGYNSDDMQ